MAELRSGPTAVHERAAEWVPTADAPQAASPVQSSPAVARVLGSPWGSPSADPPPASTKARARQSLRPHDLLTLQRLAGNAAVTDLVVSRLAFGVPAVQLERSRVATGSESDAVSFVTFFELATAAEVLRGARFDSGVAFSSVKLQRTWELLVWVVSVAANRRRSDEVRAAAKQWDDLKPTVTATIRRAAKAGMSTQAASQGLARLETQLYGSEAAELARAGERRAAVASPDAGLYLERDRQLRKAYGALRAIVKEGGDVIQWNDRHVLRAVGGANVGDLSDNQIRWINAGRTALGWASLLEDYKTLDARIEAAKRQGWISEAATRMEFYNRATSVVVESINTLLAIFKTVAQSYQLAMAAATKFGVDTSKSIAQEAVAEIRRLRWQERADAIGAFRVAVGLAGALQIVSSTLNLIRAIQAEDLRAGVGAGHGIIQGAITLGGAVVKASTATTTLLSGTVAVAWFTIEAIFDIAELSAWGRRQAAIAEIARPLEGAASLIPWGKRMAGVADALQEIDSTDADHRAELEDRLIKRGTEPFNTVLRGMLGVQTFIQRHPNLEAIMGADARRALSQLNYLQYRSASDPVSPWDIQMLTEIAAPVYVGLQRVGQWAIARYGEDRNSEESQATLKALEAGTAVAAP